MTMLNPTTLTIIQLALSAGILLLLIFVAASLRQIYAQLAKLDFTLNWWRSDWNLINFEELERRQAPRRF
jgi:hypothetical protein